MKGVELSQLGETSGRRILHAPEFIPEHSQESFSQGLQQGLSNARQRFLSRRRADTGISSAQRLGTPSSTSSFRGYFVLLSYAHTCYVPLQAHVHGFERTLVLSAMFWCFRKRTGMKQPNLMSRAGIASAQQKRAPPGRQRKKQLLGNARRRKLHRSKTPSWTRAERTE